MARQPADWPGTDFFESAVSGLRQRMSWLSLHCAPRRRDGSWLAGLAVCMILAGLLPLSFLAVVVLMTMTVTTCLRAFAFHACERQLAHLAMQQQRDLEGGQGAAAGTADAPVGAAGTSGGRWAGHPAFRAAWAAAGSGLSLLNLRLSLVDGDFASTDYQLLLRLDELEGPVQHDQPPPPQQAVPEAQLALLPVHVHRAPAKRAKPLAKSQSQLQQRPAPIVIPLIDCRRSEAASHARGNGSGGSWGSSAYLIPASSAGSDQVQVLQRPGFHSFAAPAAGQQRQRHHQQQRWPPQQQQLYARQASPPLPPPPPLQPYWASQASLARAGTACSMKGAAARMPPEAEEGGDEDEEEVCSVCLDPFEDGAKVLTLPCGHQFHAGCVTQWLRLKGMTATCPNCKANVFQQQPMVA